MVGAWMSGSKCHKGVRVRKYLKVTTYQLRHCPTTVHDEHSEAQTQAWRLRYRHIQQKGKRELLPGLLTSPIFIPDALPTLPFIDWHPVAPTRIIQGHRRVRAVMEAGGELFARVLWIKVRNIFTGKG